MNIAHIEEHWFLHGKSTEKSAFSRPSSRRKPRGFDSPKASATLEGGDHPRNCDPAKSHTRFPKYFERSHAPSYRFRKTFPFRFFSMIYDFLYRCGHLGLGTRSRRRETLNEDCSIYASSSFFSQWSCVILLGKERAEEFFHVCFVTFDLDSNERCQGSTKEEKPEYHWSNDYRGVADTSPMYSVSMHTARFLRDAATKINRLRFVSRSRFRSRSYSHSRSRSAFSRSLVCQILAFAYRYRHRFLSFGEYRSWWNLNFAHSQTYVYIACTRHELPFVK